MIQELLRPDPDGFRAAAAAFRLAFYIAALGAAGLTLFTVSFGGLQEPVDDRRARRWTAAAALLGILLGAASLAAQVALAADGTLTDLETWKVLLSSRLGNSFLLACAGLLAAAVGTLLQRSGSAIGSMGTLSVAMSFAAMGHTTQHQPRQLLAGVLVLHLLAVAFWAGSLPPLVWSSRRSGPAAAALVEAWSRAASWIVPILVAAGLVLAWTLTGSVDALLGTYYGRALLVKVALVSLLFGFAVWHRFRLTPRLASDMPGAGNDLARSICWEAGVMVLVFWAVAEMTSTSPGGEG